MRRPLYDQLVPYYELVEGRDWAREIKLIVSVLRRHGSQTVVDLGCGTGYHDRKLAELGFDTTGVDISRPNVSFARRKAEEENVTPRFVAGSYYNYRPSRPIDAALCLNWSIPTRDREIRHFLTNTRSILRMGGLLIFDYERVSQIVWTDVGKPIINSWDLPKTLIVRVSVGRMISNVLYSRDVYILFPKNVKPKAPNEVARYTAGLRNRLPKVFADTSYVRFFSPTEVKRVAKASGFRVIRNYMLPRNQYHRCYAVLQKVSEPS